MRVAAGEKRYLTASRIAAEADKSERHLWNGLEAAEAVETAEECPARLAELNLRNCVR
jgi:hypothetical protein